MANGESLAHDKINGKATRMAFFQPRMVLRTLFSA